MTNVYRKALEVLDERGWLQPTLIGHDGRVCMLGALGEAESGDASLGYWLPAEVYAPLHRVVCEQYDYCHSFAIRKVIGRLTSFNDQRGRTEDEVRAVLEKAAVLTEEQA